MACILLNILNFFIQAASHAKKIKGGGRLYLTLMKILLERFNAPGGWSISAIISQ
jgi:hypothetical protein